MQTASTGKHGVTVKKDYGVEGQIRSSRCVIMWYRLSSVFGTCLSHMSYLYMLVSSTVVYVPLLFYNLFMWWNRDESLWENTTGYWWNLVLASAHFLIPLLPLDLCSICFNLIAMVLSHCHENLFGLKVTWMIVSVKWFEMGFAIAACNISAPEAQKFLVDVHHKRWL